VQLCALTGALKKEQATQDLPSRQITEMQPARVTKTPLWLIAFQHHAIPGC
jgi:hypothetical protein